MFGYKKDKKKFAGYIWLGLSQFRNCVKSRLG